MPSYSSIPPLLSSLLTSPTQDISWLEMSKLIPTLFLNYTIELVDPSKDWSEECT